ncbi:hypothetical protein IT570_04705 [Candidatus Sumerlaeota bacterium]|nr:hypothetical protein [Candidatus Sumerlaeota bacterium]
MAGLWRALPDMVDDAYITFHCVQNLVHHGELTFNLGTRVEAFSNPLLAFLLMPFEVVGASLPMAARLIGFASFIAAIACVYRAVLLMRRNATIAALAGACMAGSFPFLYYSVTGLETGLFGALLTALAVRLMRVERGTFIDALLVFAVLCCRPEAPLYIGLLFLLVVAPQWTGKRSLFVSWIFGGVAFLLIVLLRKWYFGLWFPNPFYAKAAGSADLDPKTSPAAAALAYVLDFFWRSGFVVPIMAAIGIAGNMRDQAMRISGCLIAGGIAFAVYSGGDWFPAGRYLLPILPLLIVVGTVTLFDIAGRRGLNMNLMAAGLAISVAAGSVVTLVEFTQSRNRYPYHVMNGGDCASAAAWMREHLPADTRMVAYRIGALGYETGFHVIDLLGLADHEIAGVIAAQDSFHPAIRMGDDLPGLRSIIEREKPTAVLGVQFADTVPLPERRLYGLRFVLVRAFPQGGDQQWTLYRREDLKWEGASGS